MSSDFSVCMRSLCCGFVSGLADQLSLRHCLLQVYLFYFTDSQEVSSCCTRLFCCEGSFIWRYGDAVGEMHGNCVRVFV